MFLHHDLQIISVIVLKMRLTRHLCQLRQRQKSCHFQSIEKSCLMHRQQFFMTNMVSWNFKFHLKFHLKKSFFLQKDRLMKSMDHRNCLMKIMACHLPCRHLHPLLQLSTRLTPRQLQLPKHQQQLPSLRHIRLEFFLQHRQSWSLLLMFHQSQCHHHLWGSLLIFHQPQCHHHLWGTLLIQHRPQSHLNQSRLVSRLTQQK